MARGDRLHDAFNVVIYVWGDEDVIIDEYISFSFVVEWDIDG